MVGALIQSAVFPSLVVSEGYGAARRASKMHCNARFPPLRLQGFCGLHALNPLDFSSKSERGFLSQVADRISAPKGRSKRGVAFAMFERFTIEAIEVIKLAQEEARLLGHNYVGTEQILLGLMGGRTGIAVKVLKSLRINLKDARAEVEKTIGRGSGFVAVEIPFTARARRVLELSLEEARQLGHNYIGSEHLLLGLLREGEGVATRVLDSLDPTNIRTKVIEMIGESTEGGVTIAPFEQYTANAIKVIMLAQEEARRLGHNFVGTEQILVGLIGLGTGIAAKVLKSMGINLKVAREEVEKIIGRGSGFVAVEIPFTPGAKRVIDLSLEEARQLGYNYVEPEHLLLGLLRDGENVAARVLENLGAYPSNIRKQVILMVGESTEAGFCGGGILPTNHQNGIGAKMPTLEEYFQLTIKMAEEGKLDPYSWQELTEQVYKFLKDGLMRSNDDRSLHSSN